MPTPATATEFRTVLVGALAGLGTCVVYPVLIFVPLPDLATIALAAAMGPLLGVASWGLRAFLRLHRPSLAADLAALGNALAGALLTAMLLVQAAVGLETNEKPSREAVAIWLGLDVAWDVYVGLGTLLFGIACLAHPRLGRVIGWAGIAIAAVLLAFNLYTFPTPPANAGLIDAGPLVGLWYLAVTLLVFRSLPWVRAAAGAAAEVATRATTEPAKNERGR